MQRRKGGEETIQVCAEESSSSGSGLLGKGSGSRRRVVADYTRSSSSGGGGGGWGGAVVSFASGMGNQGSMLIKKLATPDLHGAAEEGHVELLRTLINMGGDPNKRCGRGKLTPLHLAAKNGHTEAVKLLVESGADVSRHDALESSALHKAAWQGQEGCFLALLEAGADINARNMFKATPLHSALLDIRPEDWSDARLAFITGMIDKGADVNACDSTGCSAVHYVAKYGDPRLVKVLAHHGADLNLRDNNSWGWTALHVAAANTMAETVHQLLQHGADPTVTDLEANRLPCEIIGHDTEMGKVNKRAKMRLEQLLRMGAAPPRSRRPSVSFDEEVSPLSARTHSPSPSGTPSQAGLGVEAS